MCCMAVEFGKMYDIYQDGLFCSMQNYQHDDHTDFSLLCGSISVTNKEDINIRTHYNSALFVCIYKHDDGAKL